MRLTKEELIDLYQPRRDKLAGRADCPTEEELVLSTTNEIPEPERRRIAAHLTACRDCAEEYSLIQPLKSFAEQAANAEVGELPLGIAISQAKGVRITRLPWWRRFTMDLYSAPVPYALAALLLLASVALAIWMISIRREDRLAIARLQEAVAERSLAARSRAEELEEIQRQLNKAQKRYERERPPGQGDREIADLRNAVEELSRPQLNIPIIQLEPQGSTRGGQPSAEVVIEVPPGANLFTLVLNAAGEHRHSNYALEIVDQSGRVVWHGRGLRRSPYDTFTIAIARRLLAAGQYHIKLYGLGKNQKELVEDFAVRVNYK